MKVQKRHLNIALFVLAAAALYNIWVYFIRPSSARLAGPPAGEQPLLQQVPAPSQQVGRVDPLTIPAPPAVDAAEGPAWRRDPFLFGDETREMARPPAPVRGADPVVRSILVSSSRRVALVDGRVVSVGDVVGAFKVRDIEKDAVVFTAPDGGERRVSLRSGAGGGVTR